MTVRGVAEVEEAYSDIRERAIDLEGMFRNMLDNKNHPTARVIWSEFTALIVDIRQLKNPRTIEQRVERIQHHLMSARDGSDVIMRIDESVHLHEHCERLRRELKKLNNY
jgi:hypothetical protein